MSVTIDEIATRTFSGQKPGTSGLRKTVKEVQQQHYIENFIQATFDTIGDKLKGSTLVISGDGRFHNSVVLTTLLRMCACHVSRVILGVSGIASTPCISALIRERSATGGIILTASHNAGGPEGDFGIKYNSENGGPALESFTDAVYARTQTITHYQIARETPNIDLSTVGTSTFGNMTVEVIDACVFYREMMQKIFDFSSLRSLLTRSDFHFVYDAMHGVAGPFAVEIFHAALGVPLAQLKNCKPSPDFGGGHPDPNLTYAHDLVHTMGLDATGATLAVSSEQQKLIPDFGAAADGDADRNMILGRQFFVTPSDSVAIIVANAKCIPYFATHGVAGAARSMPTSCALDHVAKKQNIKCFEVPTGWKFFGNLMDAGMLSICGEESFGTGSNHVREKDGIWAVLAWLSIVAHKSGSGPVISIKQIVEDHWRNYGRNYYCRYDYEGVDSAGANSMMSHLLQLTQRKEHWSSEYQLSDADEFCYTDPVDKSVSAHQGIRFLFSNGSRVVFRLSGTGSVGATIRMYIERYEQQHIEQPAQQALKPLIDMAVEKAKIKEFTGRDQPTVIT